MPEIYRNEEIPHDMHCKQCGASYNLLQILKYPESNGGMPEMYSIVCTKCNQESLRYQFIEQVFEWWYNHNYDPPVRS